jgi:hypothetical protein
LEDKGGDNMGSTGFFKGEKKKQKKGSKDTKNLMSNAPVFTLPSLVSKKKKEQ